MTLGSALPSLAVRYRLDSMDYIRPVPDFTSRVCFMGTSTALLIALSSVMAV